MLLFYCSTSNRNLKLLDNIIARNPIVFELITYKRGCSVVTNYVFIAEDLSLVLAPPLNNTQLLVTPAPGDLAPSSNLWRFLNIYVHSLTQILTHMHITKNKLRSLNKLDPEEKVAYTFNCCTQESEAGGSLFEASLGYRESSRTARAM